MARKRSVFRRLNRDNPFFRNSAEHFGSINADVWYSNSEADPTVLTIYTQGATVSYEGSGTQYPHIIGGAAIVGPQTSQWYSLVAERVKRTLTSSFVRQCEKFPEYIQDHIDTAEKIFYTLSKSVIKWQALTGKVSLTETPSIFLRCFFWGGYELRFEVFLEQTTAAFSIVKGKTLVTRSHGSLSDMLSQAEEFFNPLRRMATTEIRGASQPLNITIIDTSNIFIHNLQTDKPHAEDTGSIERFLEHAY